MQGARVVVAIEVKGAVMKVPGESEPTPWESDTVTALITGCLIGAMADDWAMVNESINELCRMDRPGLGSVVTAVVVWVDALRHHMLGGEPVENLNLRGPSVMQTLDQGEVFVIGSAKADTELHPELRWASEIIDARITRDWERFRRAWKSAPEGGVEYAMHVGAVLNCVASTVKSTEFGYALRLMTLE